MPHCCSPGRDAFSLS
jgi:hypothetical protein